MRWWILLAVVLAPLGMTRSASALPPVPMYLKQAVSQDSGHQAFGQQFAALKSKCNLCHIPGEDKKQKGHALNPFGQAMHKHLDDDAFMEAHKAKETDKALGLFQSAWTKTLAEKNDAGQPYGEVIKGGKLP